MECVKAARESGYEGDIFMMSDSSLPCHNPTLITYFASGKIEYDALFPYGNSFDFYSKHDVKRCFGSPVVSLDAERRIVKNANGLEIVFDKCVVATGASPIPLQAFAGVQDYVCMLRSVDDAWKFKGILSSERKRALVVGASMIGVKAAEALAGAGFDVTLADFAENVCPLAAHENCSKLIQNILEEHKIKLRFGSPVERAEIYGDSFDIYYPGCAEPEPVDHIVVCAGVRPNISFIDPGQIKMENGVAVDNYMETNVKDIYAAGDVAQGPGIESDSQVSGLWSVARLQGRTVGQNIAGKKIKYAGSLPHNMMHFFDCDFAGIGDVKSGEEVYEFSDSVKNRYCRLAFEGKNLTGINLLNIPEISGILKYHLTKSIASGDPLNELKNESLGMNKLYEKFPNIEKIFMEKR